MLHMGVGCHARAISFPTVALAPDTLIIHQVGRSWHHEVIHIARVSVKEDNGDTNGVRNPALQATAVKQRSAKIRGHQIQMRKQGKRYTGHLPAI